MVEVIFTKEFKEIFLKIKDNFTREKIIKQIEKIKTYPEIGKPMRNVRNGTREVYIGSFRLSYEYLKNENLIYILDIYHKDEQ